MNEAPEKKYPPVGKARDAFDKGTAPGKYLAAIEQTAFQRDKALKREIYYWVLIVILICAMAWIALNSNYRVYAVRVDNTTGRIENAQELKATSYSPREAEVKFFLREFIKDIRTIGKDPVVFRQNWETAQHFLSEEAANKLMALVQKEDFFSRIGNVTQQPDILLIQEQPGMKNTYQVRWTEDVFFNSGVVDQNNKKLYVGLFTIRIQPPKEEKELEYNPLGFRIIDLSYASEN